MTTKKKPQPRRVTLTTVEAIRLMPVYEEYRNATRMLDQAIGAILKAHDVNGDAGWTLEIGEKDVELVEAVLDE